MMNNFNDLMFRTAVVVQHFIIKINENGEFIFKNTSTPFRTLQDLTGHFKEDPIISDGMHYEFDFSRVVAPPLVACTKIKPHI